MVIEAVFEEMGVKETVFKKLDEVMKPGAILASNTSSLSVTAMAAVCQRPGRVAGWHFFNPVPLMKIVEVVAGTLTEPWVCDTLLALAKRLGHTGVLARDLPGFIVNHAGRAYGTEALRIVHEGVTIRGVAFYSHKDASLCDIGTGGRKKPSGVRRRFDIHRSTLNG